MIFKQLINYLFNKRYKILYLMFLQRLAERDCSFLVQRFALSFSRAPTPRMSPFTSPQYPPQVVKPSWFFKSFLTNYSVFMNITMINVFQIKLGFATLTIVCLSAIVMWVLQRYFYRWKKSCVTTLCLTLKIALAVTYNIEKLNLWISTIIINRLLYD